jgi:hypothetical protein
MTVSLQLASRPRKLMIIRRTAYRNLRPDILGTCGFQYLSSTSCAQGYSVRDPRNPTAPPPPRWLAYSTDMPPLIREFRRTYSNCSPHDVEAVAHGPSVSFSLHPSRLSGSPPHVAYSLGIRSKTQKAKQQKNSH